jgi:hypothetical protein
MRSEDSLFSNFSIYFFRNPHWGESLKRRSVDDVVGKCQMKQAVIHNLRFFDTQAFMSPALSKAFPAGPHQPTDTTPS